MSRVIKKVDFDDEVEARDIQAILAVYYRMIYRERGIKKPLFEYLCNTWVNNTDRGMKATVKSKSGDRANLDKGLLGDGMTWNVFVKGLRVLNIRRLRFTVETVDTAFTEQFSGTPYSTVFLLPDNPNTSKVIYINYTDNGQELRREIEQKQMLSVFLSKIYMERRISGELLQRYIDRWLNILEEKQVSIAVRADQRANFRRQLLNKASMTWKVFMKGLLLIGTVGLRLTVELTGNAPKSTRNITLHQLIIDLSEFELDNFLEDDDEE